MDVKNFIFIPVFLFAFGLFIINCKKIAANILLGQKENRFDKPFQRLKNVIFIAFGQLKLFRESFAGTLHFLIFWGFIFFIFAVLESIIQGFNSHFSFKFLGIFYSILTAVQDVFSILVIAAVLISLYRRFVIKVKRLYTDKAGKTDATFILLLIMLIMLVFLGQNIFHIAKNNFVLSEYEVRPVSLYLSHIFYGNSLNGSFALYEIFWWLHILLVLTFLNYIPYSKHLHILTSIPNIYFAKQDNVRATLKALDLSNENIEWYGADDIEKLSWKQILDGYSCTECGRCDAVCPALSVNQKLSPRKIILDIKRRTQEIAPLLKKGIKNEKGFDNKLVHNYITDTELWECTTCLACVQECPVMIEHVDSIVDMRRHLVLTESKFPSTLNNVFKNLETNFNPWAFDKSDRTAWAEGLNIKTMNEDPNGEILFWVGCAGPYDNRYKKVTLAFAKLMQKAGLDFRILGNEEKCNGDFARRLGNEYLAQQLIKENVNTLNKYGVKKIVTACPHCYNSLKNDFRQFGGYFDVFHHTQIIDEFLLSNRILLQENSLNLKVTYHDSCYLGRYNKIFETPRNILNKVNGVNLIEMKKNKSRGFCCGAGGGKMFLEDTEGGKINEDRTNEALQTGAGTIASACPFCMTMFSDGIKALNKIEDIEVKDIAEIILDNSL